ncbi:hypothetical protein M758_UG194400 [Ceratodon purpureus]|nr:hypothetical protein M758_UG194400 [Ceratodon purpureus]
MPAPWLRLLRRRPTPPDPKEWVGFFHHPADPLPILLCQATAQFRPLAHSAIGIFDLPASVPRYTVGAQSRQLYSDNPPGVHPTHVIFQGFARPVRIPTLLRGQEKTPIHLYVAPTAKLEFDRNRWLWPDGSKLLTYSARQGRHFLDSRTTLNPTIAAKWGPALVPARFRPDWKETWTSVRPRKESVFIWSIFHKAVAVNVWRHRASAAISVICHVCPRGGVESLFHRFYECPRVFNLWGYAQFIFLRIRGTGAGPFPRLHWRTCVFGIPLPRTFRKHRHVWSVLRGAVLWQSEIARNARVFADEDWPGPRLQQAIWDALIDAGRAAWFKVLHALRQRPRDANAILTRFDELWMYYPEVLGFRDGMVVTWVATRPPEVFLI